MRKFDLYIPENNVIIEQNIYLSRNEFVDLLRKYKANPEAIQFLADMLEF